jgi:beta-fructofuranosidase
MKKITQKLMLIGMLVLTSASFAQKKIAFIGQAGTYNDDLSWTKVEYLPEGDTAAAIWFMEDFGLNTPGVTVNYLSFEDVAAGADISIYDAIWIQYDPETWTGRLKDFPRSAPESDGTKHSMLKETGFNWVRTEAIDGPLENAFIAKIKAYYEAGGNMLLGNFAGAGVEPFGVINPLLSNLECISIDETGKAYATMFKPAYSWVGDPMPFYENGIFHVFYLLDARNSLPTFHPWYKTTTTNFATFVGNNEVIPTGAAGDQDGALGTGSVFKKDGIYYGFYTGHNGNLDPKEKIMLATSTDLITWTKVPSFLLQASNGYDRNEFRDPLIIQDIASGTYKMLIATRSEASMINNSVVPWRAVLAQYSSTNLINWTLEKPFYEDTSTFLTECPDVFTMGNYQYLIYSNIDDRMVHYKYRLLTSNVWITPTNSKLDGIAFYAGKTVFDGVNRYIVGWCPTKNNSSDANNYDWAGSLVTHRLIQHSDGTFGVAITEGVNTKFATPKVLTPLKSIGCSKNDTNYILNASGVEKAYSLFDRETKAFKIKTRINATSSTQFGFGFGACSTLNEVYSIVFDLDKSQIRLDKSIKYGSSSAVISTLTQLPLAVPTNKQFDVTIVSENSVCVVYINDEIAFTNRIYKMNQNPWTIFTDNGEVTFSDLKIFN